MEITSRSWYLNPLAKIPCKSRIMKEEEIVWYLWIVPLLENSSIFISMLLATWQSASCLPERRPSEWFLWCSLSATTIFYSLLNKSQLHLLSSTMKVEMTIYLWVKNRNCSGWGWRLADGIHEIGLKCILMSFQVPRLFHFCLFFS